MGATIEETRIDNKGETTGPGVREAEHKDSSGNDAGEKNGNKGTARKRDDVTKTDPMADPKVQALA